MRRLLVVAAVLLITAGCWYAGAVFLQYQAGQNLYKDMEHRFITVQNGLKAQRLPEAAIPEENRLQPRTPEKENLPPDDAPEPIEVDWEGLKAVNEDTVAWLQLPAVGISYPVVQGDDNSYYLHRSIEKKELFSGCLFMDSYNDPDLQNFNTIIYGHNMRDGSMFAKLKEYDLPETWAVCPYFWVYTESGAYLYRIFSSHKAEVNGKTFTVRFADIKSYTGWLQKMKESSSVVAEVELVYGDKVVTLSTCTSGGVVRQVLQGVLVHQT